MATSSTETKKINLVSLVLECAKASLAAQAFTHYTLNKGKSSTTVEDDDLTGEESQVSSSSPGGSLNQPWGNVASSFEVKEKGQLDHKSGSAATDLVTEADLATQAIIVAHLEKVFGPDLCVIGEEEECSVPSEGVPPVEEQVISWADSHLSPSSPSKVSTNTGGFSSQEVDISSVKIYIDPIDGTGAFVAGIPDVPITLIGIAVDGIPVGGVANKIFLTEQSSLSFCLKNWCCIVWGQDLTQQMETASSATSTAADSNTVLKCTYSGSVKKEIMNKNLLKLEPIERLPAKGAGNKLMMSCLPGIDICFMSPGSVKKWDTCAPEAFLRYLGGCLLMVKEESDGTLSACPGDSSTDTAVFTSSPSFTPTTTETSSISNGICATLNYGVMLPAPPAGSSPLPHSGADCGVPTALLACRRKEIAAQCLNRLADGSK